MLDGTGDRWIYERLFALRPGELRIVNDTFAARGLGRAWWVPRCPDRAGRLCLETWSAAKLDQRGELARCARQIVGLVVAGDSSIAIIGSMRHTARLKKTIRRMVKARGLGSVDVLAEHYHGMRGSNALTNKAIDKLFVVGAPRPSAAAYAQLALPIGLDPETLNFDLKLHVEHFLGEEAVYRRPAGEVESRIYSALVEAELVQAVGRARLAQNATQAFVLGSHPVPVRGLQVWPAARGLGARLEELVGASGEVSVVEAAKALGADRRYVRAESLGRPNLQLIRRERRSYVVASDAVAIGFSTGGRFNSIHKAPPESEAYKSDSGVMLRAFADRDDRALSAGEIAEAVLGRRPRRVDEQRIRRTRDRLIENGLVYVEAGKGRWRRFRLTPAGFAAAHPTTPSVVEGGLAPWADSEQTDEAALEVLWTVLRGHERGLRRVG